jgi:hypothetical protein
MKGMYFILSGLCRWPSRAACFAESVFQAPTQP